MRPSVVLPLLLLAVIVGSLAEPEPSSDIPSLPETGSGETKTLRLGEKIALDALGPTIVGEDGTLRRIANWDKLSEHEQKVAFERLKERNQERLTALREEERRQADARSVPAQTPPPNEAPPPRRTPRGAADPSTLPPNFAAEHLARLKKYEEALARFNKLSGGANIPDELFKRAGIAADGKERGKLDLDKLRETLELITAQTKGAKDGREELR